LVVLQKVKSIIYDVPSGDQSGEILDKTPIGNSDIGLYDDRSPLNIFLVSNFNKILGLEELEKLLKVRVS
jgi:hypothetical protein